MTTTTEQHTAERVRYALRERDLGRMVNLVAELRAAGMAGHAVLSVCQEVLAGETEDVRRFWNGPNSMFRDPKRNSNGRADPIPIRPTTTDTVSGKGYTARQAREMLESGYSQEHVLSRTGWRV